MSFCLGMLADAATAHRHEFSPRCDRKHHWLMSSQDFLPLVSSSCSTLTNLKTRVTPSNPLSAASGQVVRSPTSAVLEGSLVGREESNGSSRANSFTDSGNSAQRIRKSPTSAKTSFRIAHPPPVIKHRQRFNIRPKVLLQLQQLSDATRPVPILDVLPSVVFAPKLARKFPSVFKGKDGLGADDLVVVTSQNYGSPNAVNGKSENVSEDESWATREIVAAICQPKKREAGLDGITEICLNHGPLWEASSLPSGAYEFVSVDENGYRTVARWVPRPPISRRRSYNDPENSDTSHPEERRFTFSIINPNSRRHPVIATLNRSSIEVSDRYSIRSTTPPSDTMPPKQAPAPEGRHAHFDERNIPQPTVIETDEQLKSLIVVTGIFVAFREGYSPNFRYEKPVASPPVSSYSFSAHRPRSLSINHIRTNVPGSPQQSNSAATRAGSMNMSPASMQGVPSSPAPGRLPLPQRAHSTGTAFLQRANNRRPYPARENGHPPPNISSDGNSAGQLSLRRRTQKAICPKEKAMQGSDTKQRFPSAERDANISSPLASIGSAQISSVVTVPVVGDARKPSRLNKIFRFLRRASGP